ncbi:tetratricopeptide repeat protein [Streptomyces sp. NBC_01433]|uniref:tetratricopeptide repeat protein n=1 Tax=Streptomyces sp. NBC_01433 TaxID=2903864 RepID=UPI00224F95DA|nr:tetratricopeptide repeat protein [Streptomyces sp. NBC_01433]MCX4677800.1 tetratricopeptide repeat protein [Streptomyces sp. NBC_01433]
MLRGRNMLLGAADGAAEVHEGKVVRARVLGAVEVFVAGDRVVKGADKMSALFALLATADECRATVEEIKHVLRSDKAVSDNAVSQWLKLVRDVVPGVPRMRLRECSINLPRGGLDLFQFRDGVLYAATLCGQQRFDTLDLVMTGWPHGEALQGIPGAFEARRSELRMEWLRAAIMRLDAAYQADLDEWLREEAADLGRRFPRDERIFRYHLIGQSSRLGRGALRGLVKQRNEQYGAPRNPELIETIADLCGGALGRRSRRAGPLRSIPQQLPASGRPVLGRDGHLTSLREFLDERREQVSSALIALTGMPGVGKSALALRLGELVQRDYPDGVLWADLHGVADGTMAAADPEQVLDRFLADLSVCTNATGLERKSAAFRTALTTRSVLIVLDDAADAEQVLPLLPGGGACAVIVTSRDSLADLRARKEVNMRPIEPLDSETAEGILNEAVDSGVLRRVGHLISELAELCGSLPLALTVVSKRIEGRTSDGIRALVTQLREERRKLDALHLSGHDLSVRLALDCSARVLSPEARCLLWQLAVHPGPGISWSAAVDLGSVGAGGDVGRAIEELVRANLVQRSSDRYRLHDLVRAYARHELDPSAGGPRRQLEEATVRRVLDYQLQYVWAHDQVIDPGRTLPINLSEAIRRMAGSRDKKVAMLRLTEEYEAAMRCTELAVQKGLNHYIWLLPMALVTYQWRRNHHAAAYHNLMPAADACREDASPGDQAMVHRMLAGSEMRMGSDRQVVWRLGQAIRLSEREAGDAGRLSLARSLHMRAIALRRQDDLAAAEEDYRRALDMFRDLRDPVGEAAALNGLGTLRHDHSEYDAALRDCGDALRIFETTTDLNGMANVLVTLGKIHLSRSERDEALLVYQRAIGIYRDLGYWPNEARTLRRYADVLTAAGRVPDAVEALERVVELLESMGGEGLREVQNLLGNLG